MGFLKKFKDYLMSDEEDDIPKNSDEPSDETEAVRTEKKKKVKKASKPQKEKNISFAASKENIMENERAAVKDFCEQLIDISFHSEEITNEYRIVTSYLTDIQRIEELPVDIANNVNSIAAKIEKLDKSRETYLQSENLLSMEQYNTLCTYENQVTDAIKNLNEMEARDVMLRNDMGYLEGEKEDQKYMRDEYISIISKLRGIMITILILSLITCGGLMVYSLMTNNPVTMYALIVGAVAMLCFVFSYVKYLDLKRDIKIRESKLKRAVSLLNKVKAKYINNTITMDYVYEKDGVHSSQELSYQWEQYNVMVRDARKYTHTNAEFKNACDELVKLMAKLGVKDPLVWPKQTGALIDRREMVEIKHSLNIRRQKLREQLATCQKILDNARVALRAAVVENPGMESFINDTLQPYNIKIDLH